MSNLKKIFLAITFAMLFVCAADAQTKKTEQAKAWKKFQTAIARSDKAAVAEMIQFPFEASIIGTELNFKIESKTDFVKNFARIFNAARRKTIARGKYSPASEEDEFNFEMYEDGAYHVFTFRKIGGVYKLVGTMAAG